MVQLGWKYDPEKFRRHVTESKIFWDIARGDESAGVGDILGRPFLSPEGPPATYPPDQVATANSPGDDPGDIPFRLQQIAQLYESGVISHDEWGGLRARILSGL